MIQALLSLLFVYTLLLVPHAEAASTCPYIQKSEDRCKSDGKTVVGQYESDLAAAKVAHASDINGLSGAMARAATKCTLAIAAAAKSCREQRTSCNSQCDSPYRQGASCKSRIEAAADALDGQTASCAGNAVDAGKTNAATDAGMPMGDNGSGMTAPPSPPAPSKQEGGNDSLKPLLIGAGMGAFAGMMLAKDGNNKKKDEVEKGEEESQREPANCTVAAGASDSRCNAELESKCALTPELEVCGLFVARYCADSGTGSDTISVASSQGEGKGKAFCITEQTKKFCKESGRASCLSCIELSRPKPASCQTDPSSCVPQYSQAEIDSAKAACPVDPKFADPAFAASPSETGGPAVMLPSSLGRSPASDIAPQYGKSVFSISSVTMKKLCAENRLNNCPKN